MRVPTTPAHLFFLRSKKILASHRGRGGALYVTLALGANNREGKEIVKGKASRIQSSGIGSSALLCVRRNAQHREIKLPKSARFTLITAAMVAVRTGGPIDCPVSPPPLLSQNIQPHGELCELSSHVFWTLNLWTHQPGSHRISPPYFYGACLHFYAEKDTAVLLSLVDREVEFCVPTN